jgi:predicted RNA-binding Zn-ribbon protein involved in translation (DUF1610 family)
MAEPETSSQKCPACGADVDTTAAEPLARLDCPKCGEKVRVERSFNNFEIVETLGIGGMGTVYKARDTLLDRFVALKLLRDDLGVEIDHAARLQQEARVAASVNHPNVIQVFSSGTDHGKFYLVMELVDHGSLDDLIEEKKRLPEELVLEAGIQVAKGLRAAYGKGLIHRDVKPANILFADEHTAKIGDFGLAGVAAEKAENRGEIWGTPYYVAPERLNNAPEDFRSDIYSLGATLFHAVAGTAPIEGDTNSATALADLKSHPLDLRKIVPGVSAATARVFDRMIAPNPAKRFSSYDELVRELEKAESVLTGKEHVDLGRVRKMRRLIIAGAAVVIAIVTAVSVYFVHKSRQQTRVVVATAAKTSAAIPTSELERQYNDARKQLLAGKHNVAHAAFARIAIDAKNRQPIYDWVRLHQGLAALIGREPSQARQAFQEIENAGQNGFGKEDVDLAKFFVTTAKTLSTAAVVPAANAVLRADNYEAIALFLFALKDIAQLDVNDAIGLLERFATAQPSGKYSWIADYKPLAQKYLDDCRAYAALKNKTETSAAEVADLRKKLKTRTAISEELGAEERKVAAQEKKQTSAREQEQKKQAPQKKAQWLVDWRAKLIQDLNQSHYAGAITDAAGAQYTGIDGATAQTVALKTPYGIVQAPWTKLAPQTQLEISKSFIKPNAADAADRQWLCAAFASEIGQAAEAKKLAEAAVKAKPQYQEQMSILFPDAAAKH